MKQALESGDLEAMGKVLSQNHELLTDMQMSHETLDSMCRTALANGALGAKVTGGGRGGYMVLSTPGKGASGHRRLGLRDGRVQGHPGDDRWKLTAQDDAVGSLPTPQRFFAGYVFDLDGTVYLGEALLPTAGETLKVLRTRGVRTIFISNNPTHAREEYAAKLTRLGVPTAVEDILTSTLVMVDFLKRRLPGARLFVVGEEPLCAELRRGGFELTEQPRDVDAVITASTAPLCTASCRSPSSPCRPGRASSPPTPILTALSPAAASPTVPPSSPPSRPAPVRGSRQWSASRPGT